MCLLFKQAHRYAHSASNGGYDYGDSADLARITGDIDHDRIDQYISCGNITDLLNPFNSTETSNLEM